MNWTYFSLGFAMILLLVSFITTSVDDGHLYSSLQEFLSAMFGLWFMLCFLATLLMGGSALIVKSLGW
jgi:hypothetical protein